MVKKRFQTGFPKLIFNKKHGLWKMGYWLSQFHP
jgi:hypothetical protein